MTGTPLIEGEFCQKKWIEAVSSVAVKGEKSERCWLCYRFRLEESFRKAEELGFDRVGTVLSISPHKNYDMIKEIGLELEKKYAVSFLDIDFKKKMGFRKGALLSDMYGFYRQTFCGCIYSSLERRKSSGWARKVAKENEGK
jgi:predicted adenine nucleotide alpha hydrolase (AANH) superfamily ATPase